MTPTAPELSQTMPYLSGENEPEMEAQTSGSTGVRAETANAQETEGPSQASLKDASFHDDVCRLIQITLANEKLTANEQIALIDEIRKLSGVDRWTFRYAILGLALVGVLAVIALSVLSYEGANGEFASGVLAIGASAMGALAGLLSQSRDGKG